MNRDRVAQIALVAVIALGLLPFLYLVDVHPQSADAVDWIEKADPTDPRWLPWTFGTPQFQVTLRPLTALSFTASWLVGGLDHRPHRLFDLALHGLVIGLTWAVVRRRSPTASTWAALAAASVVALHPMAMFVLGDLARRSYSLASVLMLAALLVAPDGAESPSRRKNLGIAAAAIATLAALSHEVGYLAFALCAVLVVPPMDRLGEVAAWRDAVSRHGWMLGTSVGLGVGLVVWRAIVFVGMGGYRHGSVDPQATVSVSLEALFPWFAVADFGPLPSLLWAALVLGAGVGVALASGARDPVARVAIAWLLGGLALFAAQPVWFIRQVYLLVPPVALLVGTTVGLGKPRGAVVASLTMPLGLLLLVPWHLELSDGDRQRAQRRSALMDDLIATARQLPARGRLVVAMPHVLSPLVSHRPEREVPVDEEREAKLPNSTRSPLAWVERVVDHRRLVLGMVGFTQHDEPGPIWMAEVEDRTLTLVSLGDRRLQGPRVHDHWKVDGDTATVKLVKRDHPLWVFVHDGTSGRHWVVDP